MSLPEIAKLLKNKLGERGRKVSTMTLPDLLCGSPRCSADGKDIVLNWAATKGLVTKRPNGYRWSPRTNEEAIPRQQKACSSLVGKVNGYESNHSSHVLVFAKYFDQQFSRSFLFVFGQSAMTAWTEAWSIERPEFGIASETTSQNTQRAHTGNLKSSIIFDQPVL